MIVAPPNPRRPRRGYSLIEMLTVMTVISILMGAGSVTLIKINRYAQNATTRSTATTNITDVGRQFRSDIHAATSASLNGESSLTLVSNGTTVTYHVDEDGLTRSLGERTSRTLLVDEYEIAFATDRSDRPRLVRLVARPRKSGWPPREFVAAVGLTTNSPNDEGDVQ